MIIKICLPLGKLFPLAYSSMKTTAKPKTPAVQTSQLGGTMYWAKKELSCLLRYRLVRSEKREPT